MTIYLHEGDLPEDVFAPGPIAVDTETMGLQPARDRLCLIQLADGHGDEHLVRFEAGHYDAPVLKRVLADPARLKLYHFARFDLAVIQAYLGVRAGRPVPPPRGRGTYRTAGARGPHWPRPGLLRLPAVASRPRPCRLARVGHFRPSMTSACL
jgi:hypothetical protein